MFDTARPFPLFFNAGVIISEKLLYVVFTLTLKFTTGAEIIVEGRGLTRHRQQVRLHRADEIRECAEMDLVSKQEGISQVEKIYITEGEKG